MQLAVTQWEEDMDRIMRELGSDIDRTQIGGDHYTSMDIQPWDVMRSLMTPEEFQGYLWGNVLKYAMRWKKKGGVQDLEKARHYLDKLIGDMNDGRRD